MRSTSFSSSSSATRTIASAARSSDSSSATASRVPSASATSARRASAFSLRIASAARPCEATTAASSWVDGLLGRADAGLHRVGELLVLGERASASAR